MDEQKEALGRYLRHCFRNKVLPLPLLGGRRDAGGSLKELLFVDLTISPKQAYCLAENLPRFGPTAAKKLRLTNNSLPDELLALVVDAAAKNKSVEMLEIAYNQAGPKATKAIVKLIQSSPNFRGLYLHSTQTPKDCLDSIIDALCKYCPRTLQSLALQHAEITNTNFIAQL